MEKTVISRLSKSATQGCCMFIDRPNIAFIHVRKKNTGIKKYNSTIRIRQRPGKKSKQKEKKRNSATKNIVPGNPKNTTQFKKHAKNNFGHRKLIPEISEISRVLKRRLIESTKIKEVEETSAWLISIDPPASHK
jgi:hypothetical protein